MTGAGDIVSCSGSGNTAFNRDQRGWSPVELEFDQRDCALLVDEMMALVTLALLASRHRHRHSVVIIKDDCGEAMMEWLYSVKAVVDFEDLLSITHEEYASSYSSLSNDRTTFR